MTSQQNYMEQLRKTMLADEEIIASKRRFGLFSQPPPLGLGDDSKYQKIKLKKGENGKPVTEPRNLLSGLNRSGMGKKDFINIPESIYQKDPYVDSFKQEIQYQNKMHSKSPIHEVQFKPGSGNKTLAKSVFQYVEQKAPTALKKINKDSNGRVATEPANLTSNPMSKVQDKYFKHPRYEPDQYNRKSEIQKQDRQIWKKKIKHETMFKSMSHGNNAFSKNKDQYGVDAKVKSLVDKKAVRSTTAYANNVNHQQKFKLACKGHGDPIGRFPEYIPPPKAKTEASEEINKKSKVQKDREDWKPSSGNLSRPTPSIGLLYKNLHLKKYK